MIASLVLAVLTVSGHGRVRIGAAWTRLPSVTACGVALLGCLFLRDALAGWRRWRAQLRDRRLTHGEWVLVLSTMGVVAFLLSLGPIVQVGRRQAGPGLYLWLHPYVLPLRAIRGTTRFGLLVLMVVALLAGLGVAWLLRHRSRWVRGLVTAGLLGALMLDYLAPAPQYQWIATYARPVDAVLRADPDEVAVLEWPLNRPGVDVDAKLRTVGHRQRVVNGFAGFVPELQRRLSGILADATPPFASSEARAVLSRLYPLRYLLVRDVTAQPETRPRGRTLADLSGGFLRFRGAYGDDDLYEIVSLPERGVVLERVVSYDLLARRPRLHAVLRPARTQAGVEQWVDLTLNGVAVARTPFDGSTTVSATLGGPLQQAEPNVIAFALDYQRRAPALGPAHKLGSTGVTVPVDVLVRSSGQPYGDTASIRVGIGELAPNRRGYNLVALEPTGRIQDRAVFDTFGDPAASGALARWVEALPAGTIVLGAVKDDASARLNAAAVAAFATLGVHGDLRGAHRESHAFIGLKGARPGSALEASGPRAVEVRLGEPDAPFGLELVEFRLEAAGAPPRRN
jgi:hypothetical protein